MSMHLMEFGGCRRRSIGAYLKALGLFKALSGWWPRSRALWGGEVFCVYLPAGVTRDEVIDRFMNEWSPEPTFSFWNTDGGWFKKRATPPFQVPSHFTGQGGVERLSELNKRAGELVAHLNELSPNAIDDIKTVKTELITSCAQRFAWLQPWINTAMPLDAEGEPRAAALLGAGGCDGRFDIAKNALTDLIKMLRGDEAIARSALRASLFGGVSHEVLDVNPSLLNPQAGGGFNMGVKGDGAHTSTPWDVALTLSGVTLFQPALSARGDESEQAALSMPFAFTPVPVDSTQTAAEVSTKEQLAPIWERPLTLTEVTALMRDGRLRFAQRNALDAAEAMRGLARLGVERGVVCFDRYLVAERNGLSRYVVYLGSWAPSPNPREGWLRDLDARGWLSQVTLCARKTNLSSKEVPRALQARCVALLESIGRALRARADERGAEAARLAWRGVLLELGRLEGFLMRSPQSAELLGTSLLPILGEQWREALDVRGSATDRLARALASLPGVRAHWAMELKSHEGKDGKGKKGDRCEERVELVCVGADPLKDLCALVTRRFTLFGELEGAARGEAARAGVFGVGAEDLAALCRGEVDLEEVLLLARPLATMSARSRSPAPRAVSEEGRAGAQAASRAGGAPPAPQLELLAPPSALGALPAYLRRLWLSYVPFELNGRAFPRDARVVHLLAAGRVEEARRHLDARLRVMGLPLSPLAGVSVSRAEALLAVASLAFPLGFEAASRLLGSVWPSVTRRAEGAGAGEQVS